MLKMGWESFVLYHRGQGCFASLEEFSNHARSLLQLYKHRGAPAKFHMRQWTEAWRQEALQQVHHKSVIEHAPFLRKEF